MFPAGALLAMRQFENNPVVGILILHSYQVRRRQQYLQTGTITLRGKVVVLGDQNDRLRPMRKELSLVKLIDVAHLNPERNLNNEEKKRRCRQHTQYATDTTLP